MKRLLESHLYKAHWRQWLFWVIWTVGCLVVSVIAYGSLMALMAGLYGNSRVLPFSDTTNSLIESSLLYGVMFALLMSVPLAYKAVDKTILGIRRSMSFADIGYGVAGYVVYFLILIGVSVLLATLFPGYDVAQKQELGFDFLIGGAERMVAFMTLVVVAPIVEELIMRGFLFGKLRQLKMPFWPAAVVVSALFGVAHGQVNVAVDTFVLSMVACALREKTGTIWAGVALHMIKNFVAYVLLFTSLGQW